MLFINNQSITKIISNSCKGKQIKANLNLCPSIITRYSEQIKVVKIFLNTTVEIRNSNCNSLIGRPNSSIDTFDTKEFCFRIIQHSQTSSSYRTNSLHEVT